MLINLEMYKMISIHLFLLQAPCISSELNLITFGLNKVVNKNKHNKLHSSCTYMGTCIHAVLSLETIPTSQTIMSDQLWPSLLLVKVRLYRERWLENPDREHRKRGEMKHVMSDQPQTCSAEGVSVTAGVAPVLSQAWYDREESAGWVKLSCNMEKTYMISWCYYPGYTFPSTFSHQVHSEIGK